ncbi:MAG TPA: shikimate dehydrogenase [Casimicrobiaceae bacterium]|nr:shikimate dehydrogenase [Casimicrobiaceae bacterium]
MDNHADLSGETRVIAIVGDPIAQVKSPAGVTRALKARGRNAVCVPIHVTSADLEEFIRGVSLAKNLDGIIVTVPHKFAVYRQCATATERAHFLGAVNTLRRNPDGSWHGDQLDGEGFVAGLRAAGCRPEAQRALLAGAGGAGSAIGLALLEAGVAALAIHDGDPSRRDALLIRLADRYPGRVQAGSPDPSRFTLVVNATPSGMNEGDPSPVQVERLDARMFVADVITRPAVTPLIEAARRIGCGTQVGAGMFEGVSARMVDYLLAGAST